MVISRVYLCRVLYLEQCLDAYLDMYYIITLQVEAISNILYILKYKYLIYSRISFRDTFRHRYLCFGWSSCNVRYLVYGYISPIVIIWYFYYLGGVCRNTLSLAVLLIESTGNLQVQYIKLHY
jgi:hypothetical protein